MQAFDAGMTTLQVAEERWPYMTDGWKDVFRKNGGQYRPA